VLEARDRTGGRLHTIDLAGSPVDLGGSWIHMPGGANPMRAFARQAGVPCRSADPVPEMAVFDCGEHRRLPAAEAEAALDLYLEAFPEAAGRLAAELGPDASAADGIEAFVAAVGLAPGPERRARQTLYGAVEAESADLAERQSLRWMWNEIEYEGNYFGDVPDGGYRRLVDAMAAGADVRLGVDVTEVALSEKPGDSTVSVVVSIERRMSSRIRTDTTASIKTIGLLGDKYLEVTTGSPDKPDLEPDHEIMAYRGAELEKILAGSGDLVDNVVAITKSLKTILGRTERYAYIEMPAH